MDLQSRKIKFVQEFLKLQSEEVISHLEKILSKETKTLTHKEFEPFTIEGFNARIDQSMDDSKNGKLIKASDLKAKIDKWA
ncbi:hypothetical protein [Arenibacter palladensis]|uniref:hypothetical protein n=1 Tax=Arenibacter palladensis TaxID=237373 RepID=UPI0026E3518B|nr:hypothetical protein [Arenibacter palladensis]MDO6603977.1 hypothetical protein [Arenibacter palladensis]